MSTLTNYPWALGWLGLWLTLTLLAIVLGGSPGFPLVLGVVGGGLLYLAQRMSKPAARLMGPLMLAGVIVYVVGGVIWYTQDFEADTLGHVVTALGVMLVGLGLLAGLLVATVGFVLWAVRGRKQCPECAERIRPEARICRFCGYRFEVSREPVSSG